jgi:hypothetical protein
MSINFNFSRQLVFKSGAGFGPFVIRYGISTYRTELNHLPQFSLFILGPNKS